jgi:hypothetical protein
MVLSYKKNNLGDPPRGIFNKKCFKSPEMSRKLIRKLIDRLPLMRRIGGK